MKQRKLFKKNTLKKYITDKSEKENLQNKIVPHADISVMHVKKSNINYDSSLKSTKSRFLIYFDTCRKIIFGIYFFTR